MPQRFVDRSDRVVFAGVGSWGIVMGLLMLADPTSPTRVWGYPAWGGMLLIGGVLTALFTLQMASFKLRGWASALMVVGCVGRGAGLTLGIVNGTTHSVQSGLLGFGAYSMLGFLMYVVWRASLPRPPVGPHGRHGG